MKLHLQGTFLRSAVARRVFFLFVISAFIPVAILGVLSYRHVFNVVSESGQRQLSQAAGAYARTVYDHLLGASFILNADAAQIRVFTNGSSPRPANFESAFLRVYRITHGKAAMRWGSAFASPPPQIPDALESHLARGEVALLPSHAVGSIPTLWLAVRIDTTQPERGELLAELDPKYLWDDPETLPFQTSICVLDQRSALLTCSDADLGATAVNASLRGESGKTVEIDGWLTARSALFLKARFAQPEWTIIAMRPGGLAFESLTQMAQTLIGIAVATLLFVALLSVSQIRRTLVPLERLMEGTRRIENEQFDVPVSIARKDEFGQLADSLNTMASRLGQNINAMQALSRIDQQILSHIDIAQIIDRVQQRMLEILPHALVSVVVPDELNANLGTVYLRKKGEHQSQQFRQPLENLRLSSLFRPMAGCSQHSAPPHGLPVW